MLAFQEMGLIFNIDDSGRYFLEVIKEESEKLKLPCQPDEHVYLCHVLTKYLKAVNLHRPIQDDGLVAPPTTFAEIYLTALSSEGAKRKELLITVGDRALYLVGVFPESLEKTVVGKAYYINIGQAAYRQAEVKKKAGLYQRLSAKFVHLARILRAVVNGDNNN